MSDRLQFIPIPLLASISTTRLMKAGVDEGARLNQLAGNLAAVFPVNPTLLFASTSTTRFMEAVADGGARLNQLAGNLAAVFGGLAQKGWYPRSEMPIVHLKRLGIALNEQADDELNRHLTAYFETNNESIEKEIIGIAPHREHIWAAAFAAHRRSDWALSIPVMFAQADGLCFDLDGKSSLFLTENGLPSIVEHHRTTGLGPFRMAQFSPLAAQDMPMSVSMKKRRKSGFAGLNRHAVLHGESIDYGTHENACRVISLLSYIGGLLKALRKQKESERRRS